MNLIFSQHQANAPARAGPPEADIVINSALDDTSLYLNRELTWLEFNRRVIHEATDSRKQIRCLNGLNSLRLSPPTWMSSS